MWTKQQTREYNRHYAQTHKEEIRVRHREYMRKKPHSKIYKTYSWTVAGLVLIKKADKTILVEPLSLRSNIQQKILELSGFD